MGWVVSKLFAGCRQAIRPARTAWRGGAVSLALTLLALQTAPVAAADLATLVAERAGQEFGPSMPGNGHFDVRLAEGLPEQGEFIREFWIDHDTGQFIANAVTTSGEIRRVWGIAVLTIPVPVPVRRLMPDEIVQQADLETVGMPWARVNAYAVTDMADLVGMQVRRMLTPGRPVQLQSVIPPIIISRGERVTIELAYGPLHLSAVGKAISDAHLGQEVRVVNLGSNKTIVGIARADGIVEASF